MYILYFINFTTPLVVVTLPLELHMNVGKTFTDGKSCVGKNVGKKIFGPKNSILGTVRVPNVYV